MSIQLEKIGPSVTMLYIDGRTLLFSYSMLVGLYVDGKRYFTREGKASSVTTAKHIAQWLQGREASQVTEEELNRLAGV